MPRPPSNEVLTQQSRRIWRQPGGASPINPVLYAGVDTQYMVLTGGSAAASGGTDPVWAPDPFRRGGYRQVAKSVSPPDLSGFDVEVLHNHGAIPFTLGDLSCPTTYYLPGGRCPRPDSWLNGWDDWVEVFPNGVVSDNVDLGDRMAWDGDDQTSDTLSYMSDQIYAVGKIGFGEVAAPQIDREVIDVVYGSAVTCGDCGTPNNGSLWAYAITKSSGTGSPGLPGELQYTLDGGQNWQDTVITGMGATEDPTAIEIVGSYLVVLSKSANAYYYATINAITGVPGAFTKVTAGFVAGRTPNDLYVADGRNVFFVADLGYIYKATDITTGVTVLNGGGATNQNLFRMAGSGTTLVAVGAASTVLVSINNGVTFGAAPGVVSLVALTIQAVGVVDSLKFWVGTLNSGRLFYTVNGGASWVEKTFAGAGVGSVTDIAVATSEVIHIAYSDGVTARILTSWNGGADFASSSDAANYRILNLPVFTRANRIAVPGNAAHPSIAANYMLVGGLGGGVDGILLAGAAAFR